MHNVDGKELCTAGYLRVLTILLTLVMAAVLVVAIPQANAQEQVTPAYSRTLGRRGQTEMNPGGLDVDRAGNVYVTNTGNRTVAKYPAGSSIAEWVVGELTADPGPGSFFEPRDIAVAGQRLYVAEPNGRVQILDLDGNHIRDIDFPFQVPIGVTAGFDDTGKRIILVSDGHTGNVEVFDLGDNHLFSVPAITANSGTRDAATDSQGNIFVADYRGNQMLKFNPTGTTLLATFDGAAGTVCEAMKKPYGVAIDVHDRVYVAESTNSRLAVFDTDGTCLGSYGVSGEGALELDKLRRVAVGLGRNPNVYAADLWGRKILVYNQDGTFANPAQIGDPRIPGPGVMNRAPSIAVSADGVFVTDMINHRIVAWDHDGSNARTFGRKGKQSLSATFNWPQGIGIDPTTGYLWVGDTHTNIVRQFAPDGTPVGELGGVQGRGNGQFHWPLSTTFDAAGNAYVSDAQNSRVQSFDPSGAHRWSTRGWLGYPTGIVYDPTASRVLVADAGKNFIRVLDADTGAIEESLPIQSGTGPGEIVGARGVAVEPNGSIWVADSENNRVHKYEPDGTYSGITLGGLASGRGPGRFNYPQGLAIYDGELYVADSFNHRVQVFDLASGPDRKKPDGTIVFPARNERVNSSPVAISGVATDNAGVSSVWVGIKDRSARTWLQLDGTFAPRYQRHEAQLEFPGRTSTTWSFSFSPPTTGVYAVGAFAEDTAGNQQASPRPWHRFTVSAAPGVPPTYSSRIFRPGGIAPLYPAGAVADGLGNVYVANSGADRVSKIDSNGVVTTVSEADYNRPRAIALEPTTSRLWVADTTNNRIVQIDLDGNVLRDFDDDTVRAPFGIAADGSGVYVADTYNFRAVKLSKVDGSVLWETKRCFGVDMSRPRGLSRGAFQRIYVADTDNHRIVSLNRMTGECIAQFGTFGSLPGELKRPQSVTSDGAGGLYVADQGNGRIQHFSHHGRFLSESSGAVGDGVGEVRSMDCVFVDGDMVGVCEPFQFRIQRFTENGESLDYVESLGGVKPRPAGFNQPFGVAYGPAGELFVSDMFNHRVQRLNPDQTFATQWGGKGSALGLMTFPRGISVSADGSTVTLSNSENNRIDVFDRDGLLLDSITPTGTSLQWSYQNVQAPDGSYWIADTQKDRIVHIRADGTFLSEFNNGGQIKRPRGITMDSFGRLYVSNSANDRVERYSRQGQLLATLATQGSGPTNVNSPNNLTIDNSGPEPLLYIADGKNHRVLVLRLNGTHAFEFGEFGSGAGQFDTPRSVAINPVDGSIAVADFRNNRISIWE